MKITFQWRLSVFLPAGLMAIVLIPPLLGSIVDPDFFWHLAGGRWIVEHRSLPVVDPFSYTTPAGPSFRTHFILTGFWMSQVLYYGFYAIAGWEGILLLRVLLMIVLMAFLIIGAREKELGSRILIATLASLVIVHLFPLDRPHVFSFLCFSSVIYMMEQQTALARKGLRPFSSWRTIAPFLLCMLAWGNMHPGYILGQGTVFVYLLSEGFNIVAAPGRSMSKTAYRRLTIIGILGIAVPLINPNFYKTFLGMTAMYRMRYGLIDYQSTISSFKTLPAIPLYWLFLIVVVVLVAGEAIRRRIELKQIIFLLGLGYFSFTQVRYIPFLLIWAVPLISSRVSGGRTAWTRGISAGFILVAMLWLVVTYRHFDAQSLGQFSRRQRIGSYFPKDATDFLLRQGVRGRMYNYYDWGGYLIWRLYPEKSVFVDNRQMSEDVYFQSLAINEARKEPAISGRPFFKAVLESLGVDHVVVPFVGVSGQILPLVRELARDEAWVPVFLDSNEVVFVKRVARYSTLISEYGIDREIFVRRFAQFIDEMVRMYPTHTHMLLVSKGDLYASYGMLNDAQAAYREALRLKPSDRTTEMKLKSLTPR